MSSRRLAVPVAAALVAVPVLFALAWLLPTPFDRQIARLDFALNRVARDKVAQKVLASPGDVRRDPVGGSFTFDFPLVTDPFRQALLERGGPVLVDDMAGSRDLYFGFKQYHNYSLGFVYVVSPGKKPHAPGWSKVERLGGRWYLVEEG